MNGTRRREISDFADKMRLALALTTFPINVDQAVSELGGRFMKQKEGLPEASIERSKDGFVIRLAEGAFKKRERFSIAHELGHLFLHMGYPNGELWESASPYVDSPRFRFGYTEEELEANQFAGSFLMPTAEFQVVAAANLEGSAYQVGPIAEHFGVSIPAAKVRGRWLGLFTWDD